ncbi:hypothetical protein AGMMS49965_17560 [Bacteroidia bacterium]|nr:hypothetical protein AGMMS49965_17560 [Bacteroidia bacterium]
MKKIVFLILVVAGMTACENPEFFELERPVEKPWLTLTEFERAPVGAYRRCFASSEWSNNIVMWTCFQTSVADDGALATAGELTLGWYRDTEANKSWLDNDVFPSVYSGIVSICDALQFVEEKGGNPYPTISQEDKKNNLDRIVGELHFVRGFLYYYMATLYCTAYVPGGTNDERQIPLVTKRPLGYTDATNVPLGSVQEVWDLILSDFKAAYDLLPERYIEGKMHIAYSAGRANQFSAAAMLARTYFALGNYPEARKYASFVIDQNGGDYDLSEDPIEAFNKSTNTRGKEVLLYSPNFDKAVGATTYNMATYNHRLPENPCPWNLVYLHPDIVKRLGWMDNPKSDTTINQAARIDKRFQQLIAVREPSNVPEADRLPDRYYETRDELKWRTLVADKALRGPEIQWTNIAILRLAEMYLTRSICAFKAGDKQDAANDLNVVRKRAWDENVAGQSYESSAHFVTAANITEAVIEDERIVEMFCEGDRINYLRGLKVDIPPGEHDGGPIPYTSKKLVWKVPQREVDLNQSYR